MEKKIKKDKKIKELESLRDVLKSENIKNGSITFSINESNGEFDFILTKKDGAKIGIEVTTTEDQEYKEIHSDQEDFFREIQDKLREKPRGTYPYYRISIETYRAKNERKFLKDYRDKIKEKCIEAIENLMQTEEKKITIQLPDLKGLSDEELKKSHGELEIQINEYRRSALSVDGTFCRVGWTNDLKKFEEKIQKRLKKGAKKLDEVFIVVDNRKEINCSADKESLEPMFEALKSFKETHVPDIKITVFYYNYSMKVHGLPSLKKEEL